MTGQSIGDLESLSSQKLTYLYLDAEGSFQLDHEDSFLGGLKRIVFSLLGQRDYNLTHLLPAARGKLSEKNIQFLNGKLAKKVGLHADELETLQILSIRYFKPEHLFTPAEKERVSAFLEKARKSERVEEALGKLQEGGVTLDRVHSAALQSLYTYSHLMKKGEKLTKAFKKIEDLTQKLNPQGELTEPMKKKISLKEMRALEKVAQVAPILREFSKLGLELGEESRTLRKQINLTENTLNRLHNLIDKENPPTPLNFIFYDLPNFTATKPSHLNPFVPLIFRYLLRTDISHASFSYRNSEKKEMETHILGEMVQNRRSLTSYAYKTFSPAMDQFFFNYPTEVQSQLKAFYGPDWKEVLGRKYHRILIELLKNPTYEDLPSSAINQFISSLGLGCMLSEGPLQKRLRVSEYKGCICTEYVMKTLRQAYTKLEKQVEKDFALRAKRQGTEEEAPKLPNFLSSEQVAASLSPAGLARVVQESGAMHERARPKILGQVLDYREYAMDKALNLPLPWKGKS
ncbi:MAG: hypothetical protein AB7N99_05845 [Simkaniaceae bacterium]